MVDGIKHFKPAAERKSRRAPIHKSVNLRDL
eukprot:CAMPEP_0185615378 /NCGR_PEP_ID=MMETSP0436-20130131/35598_1 /TAXON_ID=626734 ORGANISM="Favella taraikaensis, Strain Fe Narragansett Bay" /NCGR_SAMPLE_ID=MMETSP0436 /ASSEMBLY_ACC=CAM_ASM_000390 /LENGTH=30 /DNA_ID= /DNA_START= /DNA_END= /DNA_ORIENTATION=